MKNFLRLTLLELKLQVREPLVVIFTLAFPVLIMFVFGAIFGNSPLPGYGGAGQLDISIPGYIGMIIGTVGMIGMPVTIASYREKGILRRLSLTPLGSTQILCAQVASHAVLMLAGIFTLLLAAYLAFDVSVPVRLAWLLPPAILGGSASLRLVSFWRDCFPAHVQPRRWGWQSSTQCSSSRVRPFPVLSCRRRSGPFQTSCRLPM